MVAVLSNCSAVLLVLLLYLQSGPKLTPESLEWFEQEHLLCHPWNERPRQRRRHRLRVRDGLHLEGRRQVQEEVRLLFVSQHRRLDRRKCVTDAVAVADEEAV